ncbi:uncharacterized protein NPIL_16531 [Nephila pilipes]|uniref:Uncharacterized protein n=1 Tax=Nephila pilipes TaxID=299642 RepID=A0A8X6N5P2_NEPPI|nr:uncharacterized protein NPIL_16531 [Nephila pilipes]
MDVVNQALLEKNEKVPGIFRYIMKKEANSCDIRHMFRRIEINIEERHIQTFLWKHGSEEAVQIYTLKTAMYANIVLQDVYLDDILTGCYNLKELEILKSELEKLFKSSGMSLHKWCFSHSNSDLSDLQFDQYSAEDTVKALGV